ncbi:hypothetical protein CL653_01285 [bacterium]|nr:hypothetical protein [bacterium]
MYFQKVPITLNSMLKLAVGSILFIVLVFSAAYFTTTKSVIYRNDLPNEVKEVLHNVVGNEDQRAVVNHIPLPDQVKAIYMSACVVGTNDFRERLVKLVRETEVNSLVIDIKDFSGSISFNPENESWQYAWEEATCGARDMKEFISYLHEEDIFVIGRITVFQDPIYTRMYPEEAVKKADRTSVWQDYKGLSFIDVGSHKYWDHLVELARASYNIGFDELNFDYVRYPSDGPMNDISFVLSERGKYGTDMQANLEAFFAYLHDKLSNPEFFADVIHTNTGREKTVPYISADLFGMTTTNTDDLSIGQVIERASPYFDFIAPMVYPSHYPKSFLGLGNPNDHPYKVVHYAMESGVARMLATTTVVSGFRHERIGTSTPAVYKKPAWTARKLRTWIQDFDYGGDYDAADVRAQIKASYDADVHDWMIWAPSNIYTREALENATTS